MHASCVLTLLPLLTALVKSSKVQPRWAGSSANTTFDSEMSLSTKPLVCAVRRSMLSCTITCRAAPRNIISSGQL